MSSVCAKLWIPISIFLIFGKLLSAENYAEELFEAGLYDLAIPAYENQIEKGDESAKTQLAACFFVKEEYQKVIDLLSKKSLDDQESELLALAYLEQNEFDKSLKLLEKLSASKLRSYHIGRAYYFLKDWDKAEKAFQQINFSLESKTLYFSAEMHLILIAMERKNFLHAEKKLNMLKEKVSKSDDLYYQLLSIEGDLCLSNNQFEKALLAYTSAIPKRNKHLAAWTEAALHRLAFCYSKMSEAGLLDEEGYRKAEQVYQDLIVIDPQDSTYLALAELLLNFGNQAGNEEAYAKAKALLSKKSLFSTQEGFAKAQLLQAEKLQKYDEREALYAALTEGGSSNANLAESWYLRGINNYNEGEAIEKSGFLEQAKSYFAKAVSCLSKAYELFKTEGDVEKSLFAKKYLAMASYQERSENSLDKALTHLQEITEGPLVQEAEEPLEIYLQRAALTQEKYKEFGLMKALEILKEGLEKFPIGELVPKTHFQLGRLYYINGDYESAEDLFVELSKDQTAYAPLALYWAFRSAEASKKSEEIIKNYKQKVFEQFPESSVADECYFTFYSWQEYLQGERKAIKHLQNFAAKFPNSPYLLNAFYLLGTDLKRDRKSYEGKWITRKNLTAAIEAFKQVETHFHLLYQKKLIPDERLLYYASLLYQATLERALANFAIAEESDGAKGRIYLEYSREIFEKIASDFESGEHPWTALLKQVDSFPKIEEESCYWLTKTYWLTAEDAMAEKTFQKLIQRYRNAKITKGNFLAKLWIDRGIRAAKLADYKLALESFDMAEEAAKGKILSTDETLDLYIQQSICYQELGELDQAMLILSKVINCDAASSLRLKAMFLRAENYERQGRPLLAKRQLETVVLKGGEWAKKAQEKLDKEYGFD